LRGGVSLDNSGSKALGRGQLSANLALDNPLGLNDIVSTSLNTNLEQPTCTHRSQSASTNYSVPWGYTLLSLSASESRFAQYVQGTTVKFLSSGRSSSAEGRLQYTAWRTASSRMGLYGSIPTRRAVSYLDDVEVLVQRRRTTSLETGISYRHLFESSSFELDAGLRRGMPWRGAQEDFATAADGGLTLRPKVATLSAAWATDLTLAGTKFQYSGNLRGQHTRSTTLSIDQISIGGRGSVRGFDGDAVLIAESGLVLRKEISTAAKVADGIDGTAFVGLDWGRVWGPSDSLLAGNRLAGIAIGLRGRRGLLQFETTVATPLYRPAGFHSRRFNVYGTVTRAF
jgi:hemolysin activation/secretion protein